mmetsp:Transcript_9426/g.15251  ORF Transcript_9426/g.15251 Transcript_9426/m.15251 type:complete len:90 (+) Transcript_9426:47-316(+)
MPHAFTRCFLHCFSFAQAGFILADIERTRGIAAKRSRSCHSSYAKLGSWGWPSLKNILMPHKTTIEQEYLVQILTETLEILRSVIAIAK